MSDSRFWIVMACLLVLAVTAIVLVRVFERRRMAALRKAGEALGLTAFAKGAAVPMPSVPLARKRGRRVGAALSGTWGGCPVLLFDLSHPAGKSVSVQTVLAMRHEGLRLPELAAIERHFNRYLPSVDLRYLVPRSSLLGRAYRLYTRSGTWPFSEDLDRWLVAHRGRDRIFRPGWSFEAAGNAVLVYRRGVKAPTPTLRAWLDEASAANKGFAAQAARSLAEQPGGAPSDEGSAETSEVHAFDAAAGKVRVRVTVKTTVGRRPDAR